MEWSLLSTLKGNLNLFQLIVLTWIWKLKTPLYSRDCSTPKKSWSRWCLVPNNRAHKLFKRFWSRSAHTEAHSLHRPDSKQFLVPTQREHQALIKKIRKTSNQTLTFCLQILSPCQWRCKLARRCSNQRRAALPFPEARPELHLAELNQAETW